MSANTHLAIKQVSELMSTLPAIPQTAPSMDIIESHAMINATTLIRAFLQHYKRGTDEAIDSLFTVRPYEEDYISELEKVHCAVVPNQNGTGFAMIHRGTFLYEVVGTRGQAARKVCHEKGWLPQFRSAQEWWYVTDPLARAISLVGGTVTISPSGKMWPLWHREFSTPLSQDPILHKAQLVFVG